MISQSVLQIAYILSLPMDDRVAPWMLRLDLVACSGKTLIGADYSAVASALRDGSFPVRYRYTSRSSKQLTRRPRLDI